MKIKILYGLEASSGGALKHVVYLATHLDRNFFDITVILSLRDSETYIAIDKLRTIGINVIVMSMSRDINFLNDFLCLFSITKYLLKNKFDIVHSHSSKAGFYFRIAAFIARVRKNLYTPHCFYFQSKKGWKRLIYIYIEKLLGLLSDNIIVSNNEREECIASKIVPENKLVNINNAINFAEYIEHKKETIRPSFNIPFNSIVIGTIGRLVKQKDILSLLYAARILIDINSNVYFIIAGTGELSDSLYQKIIELDLEKRVFMVGHYSEIGKVFSVIDIFISTSLWEGLPYVLLEAMWYKKPIVATSSAYSILDEEQLRYMVTPGNIHGICEKLTQLINDSKMRCVLGKMNRANIETNFSFEKFVRLHEKLYLN